MSDPFWLFKPPYIIFTVGAIAVFAAVVWTYTGKAWDRYRGWVYRAKEPKRFWWVVAMHYLVGIGLIGYFLCLIN